MTPLLVALGSANLHLRSAHQSSLHVLHMQVQVKEPVAAIIPSDVGVSLVTGQDARFIRMHATIFVLALHSVSSAAACWCAKHPPTAREFVLKSTFLTLRIRDHT